MRQCPATAEIELFFVDRQLMNERTIRFRLIENDIHRSQFFLPAILLLEIPQIDTIDVIQQQRRFTETIEDQRTRHGT